MTASVARCGVVGHPVAHSLSPRIHARFADARGIALEYVRIDAPPDAFATIVAGFFADGGRGLNVTLPFKRHAFALCGDRATPRATLAGAVNTLSCIEGALAGDNTDGLGLVADLERVLAARGERLERADVLLIGAGGAAAGTIGPLFDAGIDRMTIVARDPLKAVALALAFAPRRIDAATFEHLRPGATFDVLVNATSASLVGASLPIGAHVYARAHLAYDLMYGPGRTRFVADALAGGAGAACDGLGMLVEQAAESFRVWHGVRPETDAVREGLREELDAP